MVCRFWTCDFAWTSTACNVTCGTFVSGSVCDGGVLCGESAATVAVTCGTFVSGSVCDGGVLCGESAATVAAVPTPRATAMPNTTGMYLGIGKRPQKASCKTDGWRR